MKFILRSFYLRSTIWNQPSIAKCSFFAISILFNSTTFSQPLPNLSHYDRKLVQVGKDCQAFSWTPNPNQNRLFTWHGPCEKQKANGQGVILSTHDLKPVEIAWVTYKNGHLESVHESYAYQLGRLTRKSNQEIVPLPSTLPEWAKPILSSQEHWKAWRKEDIAKRQAEASLQNQKRFRTRTGDRKR